MAANDLPQDAKVFDIAKPGKIPPPETSRPTIVGHKPMVGDPMVTAPQATEPTAPPITSGSTAGERVIKPLTEAESAKPTKIGDTIIDIKAGTAKASPPPASIEPTMSAVSIDPPEALTATPKPAESSKSKPVLLPDSELETPAEEPKPEPAAPEKPAETIAVDEDAEVTPVKVTKAAKTAKQEPVQAPAEPTESTPAEAAPETPVDKTEALPPEAPAEKPVEQSAEKPATQESQVPTPSETAAANASIASAAEAAKAAATPEPEIDVAHIEELIAQKKYFVKIGQKSGKGSTSNAIATGILLGLLVVIGIAAAWDAGYITVGIKAPFDFITDKAP